MRYQLKTPYRDGTTHIVMEPLDLMARLAALIPSPRMHLTRYHGVFAPHSRPRVAVTPAKRGLGAAKPAGQCVDAPQPATPRHVAMNWARRLKWVIGVEIEGCARCGGKLRIIANIEERRSSRASWRIWTRQPARIHGRSLCHGQHGRRLHSRD